MEDTYQGIWIKPYQEYCYFLANEKPAYYLRCAFAVPQKFRQAKLRICGLGWHELYINGQRADDRWFAPALSQYDCRVGSITYDIGHLLLEGQENVVMVHLGNGFYNCRNSWKYTVNYSSWRSSPRMVCDVEVDGKVIERSGLHWKTHSGPVTFDCHHEGEDYDARLELPDAAFQPGFDDSKWESPFRAYPPGGLLEQDNDEPCRILESFPGKNIAPVGAPYAIYDFGKNFSGVVCAKFCGPAGAKLTFRYSEILGEDGRADTSDIDQGVPRFETDSYTLKGNGIEVWHPHFVWHGFRYVDIVSTDATVEILEVTGWFISSDLPVRGHFTCNDACLNTLQEITLRSYRSNFMGIPTDCPTREKFGWAGDAAVALETGWWNYDPRKGLRRLADMLLDIQRQDGNLSTHAPTTLWGFEQSCPSYALFLYDYCRHCHDFEGDDSCMRLWYDRLVKGVRFFEMLTMDDHLCHVGYGDWMHPDFHPGNASPTAPKLDPTSVESLALYSMWQEMAFFARHLDHQADAAHYSALAEATLTALRKTFYDTTRRLFDQGFWTSTAMALRLGVIPKSDCQTVAESLVQSIRERGHRVHAGIQGARHIPCALADFGYVDDAYQMFVQPEEPGWGNLVALGATSLWEKWNGKASRNHIMFGFVSAWLYRYLAGFSPAAPGFRRIRIAPCFAAAVQEIACDYKTPLGLLAIRWKRETEAIHCHLTVPPGAVAEVVLPNGTHEITGKAEMVI